MQIALCTTNSKRQLRSSSWSYDVLIGAVFRSSLFALDQLLVLNKLKRSVNKGVLGLFYLILVQTFR